MKRGLWYFSSDIFVDLYKLNCQPTGYFFVLSINVLGQSISLPQEKHVNKNHCLTPSGMISSLNRPFSVKLSISVSMDQPSDAAPDSRTKSHCGAERFPAELSKEIFGQKGLEHAPFSKDHGKLWRTMV